MQNRKSAYDYDDLIACGHGELFADTQGPSLPLPPMLMFDRITHISESGGAHDKGRIEAEFDINPDLWFFKCHFEGDPVMPGCLGLDALWQLVGFFLGWKGAPGKGRALGVGEVKFTGMVLPEHQLVRYHINLKRVITRRLVMAIGDGELEVDGETIYTATDLRVGLFQDGGAAA